MIQRHFPSLAFILLVLLALTLSLTHLKGKKSVLTYTAVDFADMTGWASEDPRSALLAFQKSCEKINLMPSHKAMPGNEIGGKAGDWQPLCASLDALLHGDRTTVVSPAEARAFFEQGFTPFSVTFGDNPTGIFTGYYEPLLYGSLTQSERYSTPLLARPEELVMVDLGEFRGDLKGRRIAGHVVDGRLKPYPDRAAIDKGALEGRTTPLVWVDDPVMAFSLHIQGSGRVQLTDGRMMRIGYAAQNGHPYVAIGRVMVKKGYLKRGEVTMPAIQKWLRDNPDKAQDVMQANPSYVFLRLYEGDGPFGSAGVALTPRRSLAVDRRYLPLNAPLFLSTSYPDPESPLAAPTYKPFNQLMIAQDTGGAINGAIRGDIFWGYGKDAEEIAGRMAQEGHYYLLLPKPLALSVVQKQGR